MANVWSKIPSSLFVFPLHSFFRKALSPQMDDSPSQKIIISTVSGSLAGAISALFLYPFDFARIRLAADLGKPDARNFVGTFDVLSKILKSDGIRSWYRGFTASVAGIMVYRSAYFGLYELVKNSAGESVVLKFLLAQGVTITSSALSYTFSTVKARMMMQAGRAVDQIQYNGMIDCFRKIIKDEGPRHLLSGFSIKLFLSISGALSLVVYDELRRQKGN